MSYAFKGHDWEELADCWGIKVEPVVHRYTIQGSDEFVEASPVPEQITVTHLVNDLEVVFTVTDEAEVLAEKVKRHIRSKIDGEGKFHDPSMRDDLVAFLTKLAEEEEKTGFSAPVFRAIAEVENDRTLANWVIRELENLWS